MTEETRTKRGYRKVKSIVKDVIGEEEGLTVEEITTKSGVMKWYVQKVLNRLVEKGEVNLVDGKYTKKGGE